MDPNTKYLVLVASPQDMEHPSVADLKAILSLRHRIDDTILRSVSVRIAPKLPGPLQTAEILLGKDRDLNHTRHPNGEKFDAAYISRTLRRVNDSEKGVLAVVPAKQLNGIAESLIKGDKRPGVSDIRTRASQPIAPGTGIVAIYRGKWLAFDPANTQIVQFSCPLTAECISAPAETVATRRSALLVAALSIAALTRRMETRKP